MSAVSNCTPFVMYDVSANILSVEVNSVSQIQTLSVMQKNSDIPAVFEMGTLSVMQTLSVMGTLLCFRWPAVV